MRLFLSLCLFVLLALPCMAKDVVRLPEGVYDGKIRTFSDGLVVIVKDGVEHSASRTKNNDYYGDYLVYAVKPFSKSFTEVNCRIIFIDMFSVTFQTPDGKFTIPRYRVKSLLINAV